MGASENIKKLQEQLKELKEEYASITLMDPPSFGRCYFLIF